MDKPFPQPFTNSLDKKTLLYYTAFVYLAVFTWMLVLIQGFPIGDVDDWVILRISKDLSWKELIDGVLRPWSKSEYWSNQVMLIDQVSYKRPIHGLITKSIEAIFGLRFFPLYLAKAFFFSGTVALLFRFLVQVTCSYRFAASGALFFLLVPAHYIHVLWISDPGTVVQFLSSLGVWLFLPLIANLEQSGSLKKFMVQLSLFLVVGWLCMKTKEPGLILPLTIGAYVLVSVPRWRTQKLKLFLLGVVLLFLVFLIVPVEHLTSGRQAFSFNGGNLYRILLRNYQVGFEDEPTTAFFSWEHIWPTSIARTFGFFSLWTLIIFIPLYWIKRVRPIDKKYAGFLNHPLVVISALWATIEILFMGLFQPEPRFFSSTMIPITVLVVRLIWCVGHMWSQPWKYVFLLIAIFAWSWSTFYLNFRHTLWLRQQAGQRSNRYMNAARLIYKDLFPEKAEKWWDIGLFYCPAYVSKTPNGPRIENVIYYAELPYEGWSKTKTGSLEEFERYAKMGAVYYVTHSKDELMNDDRVILIDTVSGINESSILERISYKLKKKKPRPLYIFKYKIG